MAKRQARRQGSGAFLDELGRDLTHLGAAILGLAETSRGAPPPPPPSPR
jgi:hypothetical protein